MTVDASYRRGGEREGISEIRSLVAGAWGEEKGERLIAGGHKESDGRRLTSIGPRAHQFLTGVEARSRKGNIVFL